MGNETEKSAGRLLSLDVFRGLTIAAMVLVNNPGSWDHIYGPLEHAPWDGWTPTDFIFPFFLFIVGVAMTFSFDKRLARGDSRAGLFVQVCRRAAILFMLGMILQSFPNFRLIIPWALIIVGAHFVLADSGKVTRSPIGIAALTVAVLWLALDWAHFSGPNRLSVSDKVGWLQSLWPRGENLGGSIVRIPGVLQRIAMCYLAASVIVMYSGIWGRLAWALALINLYYLIVRHIPAPIDWIAGTSGGGRASATAGAPFPGALHDWIDVKIFGAHLYGGRPDPEGLLSTIPSIATTLFGVLAGNWILAKRPRMEIALGMFLVGNAMLIAGWCMDQYFPINKPIWSSSYVVFMTGWALVILGACYYFIDVRGSKWWTGPFVVLGTNAILVFFASGILARLMGMIRWTTDEKAVSVRSWIYSICTSTFPDTPKNASLAFALFNVVLWLVLTYPLYRKKIFLKV